MSHPFSLMFCVNLLIGFATPAFPASPPPLDEIFTSDGEMQFGPEYRGQILRIIVVGAGGGGSSSTTAPFLTRTGAGGGSGALVYSEIRLSSPLNVSWTIGKGGAGGTLPPPPIFDRNGHDGGLTEVKFGSGQSVLAMGGSGARDVSSADSDGIRFLNPVPPLGGDGGIPWGVPGIDGNPSLKVNPGQYIPGGTGGKISGIEEGGFGGNGGGTHTQVCCGGEEPGSTGAGGVVRLQLLVPRPEYLTRQVNSSNAEAFPDAQVSLDKFLKNASSVCDSQGAKCPASVKKMLSRFQNDHTISLHSKLLLMFGSAHSKYRKDDPNNIGPWAYGTLLSFLPPAMRAIVTFVNLIPGDSRTTEIVPPPLPNSNFLAKSEDELNELYGSAIVAALWMQNTFPSNATNQSAINALLDYSNAIKEEILIRQRISQGRKDASQALRKVGVIVGPDGTTPVKGGEMRGGVGNRCLRCGQVYVDHSLVGTDCIIILCP
jgi:hypothetical protein